jgi:hypothetical protein
LEDEIDAKLYNKNVWEENPLCAECGYQLTAEYLKNVDSNEIIIRFYCDSEYDDMFAFQISTGFDDSDLDSLTEIGKKMRKTMTIELLERRKKKKN